ncbi:MAG TPA: GNAT family N-acetyltransferase [Pyrinomonadaceae bacterium]|jgi:GNAT superfamily N-acetyltransferase|nr:GNAT family N-acetyltransferase [Pyrinomonadaceae bacterium]
MRSIEYRVRPELTSDELNGLFTHVWDDHELTDLSDVLAHSLTYVCAYREGELVGYVNVAWDGGEHAFPLDIAVHRDMRHNGIGTKLVEHAVEDTRARGLKWLHVDFEPHLEGFYRDRGFRDTAAGLIRLND